MVDRTKKQNQSNFLIHTTLDDDVLASTLDFKYELVTCDTGFRKESYVVYLGGKNLKVSETKRVTVVTRRSIIHPQFELLGLKHDVALIDLHSPVSISAWVGVVTLPLKYLEDVTYTDQNMLLTAWGGHHVLASVYIATDVPDSDDLFDSALPCNKHQHQLPACTLRLMSLILMTSLLVPCHVINTSISCQRVPCD
uniref:Peptidase S1 domain-containing protein n=1 Tax=Timema tahoe TaxID=61484 RepID=A0A7R9IPM3_9NEOP|nr:unnamed protein product [Timema tahoe]